MKDGREERRKRGRKGGREKEKIRERKEMKIGRKKENQKWEERRKGNNLFCCVYREYMIMYN